MDKSFSQFLASKGVSPSFVSDYFIEKSAKGVNSTSVVINGVYERLIDDYNSDILSQINLFIRLLAEDESMGVSPSNYVKLKGLNLDFFVETIGKQVILDCNFVKINQPNMDEPTYLKRMEILVQIDLLLLILIME